ncbi:MAG: NnrS family protein [Candidatus Polarisedimenticolaceae bacterium]|nr:NnrS family protein [Candidatus Polarisedimenticolaceae bacterium]
MTQLLTKLATKPHKLFFFGGTANAIITMVMLLLHYQGLLYAKIALPTFHAYSLIFAVFTQFFAGFLLTMFPRFLAMAEVTREAYLKAFLLLNISALAFTFAAYFSPSLTTITAIGMFVAYIMICRVLWQLYRQSGVTERFDTNWILMALTAGAISHLLFLWTFIDPTVTMVRHAAIQSGLFLYLFMLILTLSQKMIPFFTEGKVAGYRANRSPYFLHMVAGLLLIKVIFSVGSLNSYGFIDGLLFIITLSELIKWRLPARKVEAILWVLYLSLIWIPIGFLLYTIEGITPLFLGPGSVVFEKVPLHTIAIGYFTTILIGFVTRIILGHAGQKPAADRYAILLFCLVQIVVIVRIGAGLTLNSTTPLYVEMITISALLWLGLFLLWSKRYVILLFR